MRLIVRAAVSCSLLATVALRGQDPQFAAVNALLPAFRDLHDLHAIGDVTGDGQADVVFLGPNAMRGGEVWIGAAAGLFRASPGALPPMPTPRAMVLVDADGDGDRDLVCATDSSAIPALPNELRLYRNDGSGRFSLAPTAALPMRFTSSIAAGDIDGDGDADLVIGHSGPSLLGTFNDVAINDGSGVFAFDSTRLPGGTPGTNAVVLLDHDGDGDVDLYCGNQWGATHPFGTPFSDQLLANDGSGFFAAVPLATTVGSSTQQVRVADFDGDGDPDVMTVESPAPTLRYRRNDGGGVFTSSFPPTPTPAPGTIAQLLLGDWNADGRADYALRYVGTVFPFVQTAPGVFVAAALPPVATGERPILALDVDGDLDTDLVTASGSVTSPSNGTAPSLWRRNLGTSWQAAQTGSLLLPPPTGSAARTELIDLDRDGHLDVVVSPHFTTSGGRIWRGDGAGGFTPAPAGDLALSFPGSGDLAFGDVDGDGDTDIVCAIRQEPGQPAPTSKLFRNVGGTFVAAPFPSVFAEQVALGDLDGDGDLDGVLAGFAAHYVIRNDGTGTFTATPVGTSSMQFTQPLALHDLDGDLDLDVVAYHVSGALGWLRNDGSGTFTTVGAATVQPAGGVTLNVVAADLDADHDVDLLVHQNGGAAHRLLRNAGNGVFSSFALPASAGWPLRHLLVVDVDADGWIDILELDACAESCGFGASRLLRNDRSGGFAAVANGLVDLPRDFRDSAVGDVDEDGDVDLMVAGYSGVEFYRNRDHQLAWYALPRVGRELRLELWGRANELCVLGVAFARVELPLPGLGVLRLDPGSLLVAAAGAYDAAGLGAFAMQFPNDPALVGASLFWQVLAANGPRLGNLEVTTLLAQ